MADGSSIPSLDGAGDIGKFDVPVAGSYELSEATISSFTGASQTAHYLSKGDVIMFSYSCKADPGAHIFQIKFLLDPTT